MLGMRILVVEDEHRIASSIKKGLEQESWAVDTAYDGESGFDMAAGEDYDAIVLDLMLPKMDGLTLVRKLRSEEKGNTPILILTARGSVEDKVEGLNSGADDYLPKPFSFSELLARIKAIARRPKGVLSPILQTHGLALDTLKKTVKRDGKEISLTRKEYALLEYLLRNKGQVLSKEKLINGVWDYDADILPNTVEVYIGYLREKLEKPFSNKPKVIETVRGFGYKIAK